MLVERLRYPKRFIPPYFGVGLALNSVLHTWYASVEYGGVRVGVTFLRIGTGVTPAVSYVAALALGVVAGFAVRTWLAELPPVDRLSFGDLFSLKVGGTAAVGIVGLLAASQLLAGASWSKAILDVVLVFFAALILVSSVRPLSLWTALSLYAAVVSVLLTVGSRWLAFTGDLSFPHFPAFGYFALASIYILGSSFLYTVAYNVEPLPRGGEASAEPLRASLADEPPSVADLAHHRATIVREAENDGPTNSELLGYFVLVERAIQHHSVRLLQSRLNEGKPPTDADPFRTRLDQQDREALLLRAGVIDSDLRRECREVRRVREELTAGRYPSELERTVADAYDAVRRLSELVDDE